MQLDISGPTQGFFSLCKDYNCSAPQNPLKVTLQSAQTPILSVGHYSSGMIQYPLLALGSNSNSTWTFPQSITTPNLNPVFTSDGDLFSASCGIGFCVVAGQYFSGGVMRPLLGISRNNGVTWSFPSEVTDPQLTPAFSSNGSLSNVSCSGTTCMAVGMYNDNNSITRPLLAVSNDSGATWSFPNAITQPNTSPAFSSNGILQTVYCSTNKCLFVGSYNDNNNIARPLIGLTYDKGSSWSFPASVTQPSLTPAFADFGILFGISCSGITCVSSGEYYDGINQRALIGVSNDEGLTWSFPVSVTQPNLTPAYEQSASLKQVSCSGNTCIASGKYTTAGSGFRSLLAVSHDLGGTWSFPSSITQPQLTPAFFHDAELLGASCDGSVCMAGGTYFASDPNGPALHPLLAVSRDSGATWSFPTEITQPQLIPSFYGAGLVVSVNCHDGSCAASGQYADSNSVFRPLLAITYNSGLTWSLPEAITNPSLSPVFSGNGQLFGSVTVSASLLPDSLKFIYPK